MHFHFVTVSYIYILHFIWSVSILVTVTYVTNIIADLYFKILFSFVCTRILKKAIFMVLSILLHSISYHCMLYWSSVTPPVTLAIFFFG